MVEYNINDNKVKITPSKFEGKKSREYYEKQIYSTLSKIGISQEFIEVEFSSDENGDGQEDSYAQAKWYINKQEFVFRCESQSCATLNLGAISQAIQEDIRQVTRGIKDLFTIMNQYRVTGSHKKSKANLLSFGEEGDEEGGRGTNSSAFEIDELSLVKIQEGERLAKEYEYLREVSNDRLEILYLNLKEECLKQNKRDHPLLRALTIMRRDRGLD